MLKPAVFVMSAILLLSACSGDAARPAVDDETTLMREVEDLIEEWGDSISEGRTQDFKRLFSDRPGFAWAEEGEIRYRSVEALAAGIDGLEASGASITNELSAIIVTPLAEDAASFSARVLSTVSSDAFTYEFNGIVTGVAVRDSGRWKLLQGHLSQPPQN